MRKRRTGLYFRGQWLLVPPCNYYTSRGLLDGKMAIRGGIGCLLGMEDTVKPKGGWQRGEVQRLFRCLESRVESTLPSTIIGTSRREHQQKEDEINQVEQDGRCYRCRRNAAPSLPSSSHTVRTTLLAVLSWHPLLLQFYRVYRSWLFDLRYRCHNLVITCNLVKGGGSRWLETFITSEGIF